jgi:hypothetical protein
MKNRIIETLAFLFGLLTTIAGVLTLPHVALLPESLQPYIGVCLALTIVGKNGAYVVLDFADNGKLDKSWRHGAGLLLLAGLLLCLASCATRPDGTRTFAGLDGAGWRSVGKAAIGGALPAYLERRRAPADVPPAAAPYVEDWTLRK